MRLIIRHSLLTAFSFNVCSIVHARKCLPLIQNVHQHAKQLWGQAFPTTRVPQETNGVEPQRAQTPSFQYYSSIKLPFSFYQSHAKKTSNLEIFYWLPDSLAITIRRKSCAHCSSVKCRLWNNLLGSGILSCLNMFYCPTREQEARKPVGIAVDS